jgi:hypothetical protein
MSSGSFASNVLAKEVDMTHSTITGRRLAAAAVLAATLTVAGCTGPPGPDESASPAPTHTPVETRVPVERPGPTEPLAGFSLSSGRFDVYEVERYEAGFGCGCSVEDGGPELYPAGSEVILLRVTLTPHWSPRQGDRTTWTVPDLTMTAEVAGVDGLAVLEEKEGPERAAAAGIPWMPEGLFPDGGGVVTNDVPVSWSAAYYLPPGAQKLRVFLDGHYDPEELDWAARTSEIEVPLPMSPFRR